MQQIISLLARGCAVVGAALIVLASALTWSPLGGSWSLAVGNWDVPAADIGASGNPLRSVGERGESGAKAHHARLVGEIAAADAKEGFELVMYGDSIIESLRGTDHGRHCGRPGCPEGPGILRAHFSDRWRTAVIATGADQTGHLLHLLRHGGTPSAEKAPKAAVLLISTNDLGLPVSHGAADPAVFAAGAIVRLKAIIAHLRAQLPSTLLLLTGLLPRGFAGDYTGQWETRLLVADERDWPNPFTQAIQRINTALRLMASTQRQVHYVDCGDPFVKDGKVTADLMSDALHPNGPGLESLAVCLVQALTPLLANATEGR